ncbi:UNVERIFIED_ORG: uncharacterized protein YoxC [Pseudomonas lini]
MPQNSQEDLESSLAKLGEKLPAIIELHNAYWSTTTDHQALLRENGVPHGVQTTSSERRFTPTDLTYVRYINLYGDNPEKLANEIRVTVKAPGKEKYDVQIGYNKHFAYIWILSFCDWFEISSATSAIKPLINKIEIFGADQKQLASYAKDIEEVFSLRQKIDDYIADVRNEFLETQKTIADLTSDADELTIHKNGLLSDLDKNRNILSKTAAQIDTARGKLTKYEQESKHLETKKTDAKNNVDQLTQQTLSLNNEISELKTSILKLTSDKSLISDEYGPYVKEGKAQARSYFWLITLPLGAIIFSIYQVYVGASNLLTAEYKSAGDIAAAFLLRIPFAAIFGLAILYSWKLAYSMIQKVFKIHEDRLTLAKLLVVARETVHSSAKNLDISDHEKFQEQTALKIEVLKSHMARDLNDNFSYKPIPSKKTKTATTSSSASNDDSVPKENESQ